MRITLFLFFILLVSMGGTASAFDPALNRDPVEKKNQKVSTESRQQPSGSSQAGEGVGQDLGGLATGIVHPVSKDVSVRFSAGNPCQFGISF